MVPKWENYDFFIFGDDVGVFVNVVDEERKGSRMG